MIRKLREYDIEPVVVDPWANEAEAKHEYGVQIVQMSEVHDADCVILAVAHNEFKEMGIEGIGRLFRADGEKVLIDVKSLLNKEEIKASGYRYWRL